MQSISLLHELPISCGTHFCRLLGSMDGVTLLSETNPGAKQFFCAATQARQWHGIEIDEQDSFAASIQRINEAVNERGSRLLVRDWCYFDFIGKPFNPTPARELGVRKAVSEFCDPRCLALIRHPVDQFIGLHELFASEGVTDEEIVTGLKLFAEAIGDMPKVRFEDIRLDVDKVLQQACEILGLRYDEEYKQKWQAYVGVTGNAEESQKTLSQFRYLDDRGWKRLSKYSELRETIELLGYPVPEPLRTASTTLAVTQADEQQAAEKSPEPEKSPEEYLHAGQFDDAVVAYRAALRESPDADEMRGNLGFCLLNTGQIDEAICLFQELLQRNFCQEQITRLLIEALSRKGVPHETIVHRRVLAQVAPGDTGNLFDLACLLGQIGEVNECITYIRKLFTYDPGHAGALCNYLMYLNYSDRMTPAEISSEHFRLGMRYAGDSLVREEAGEEVTLPLKVGFLSRDFVLHPVGKIAIPIIECLDKEIIRPFIYHDSPKEDALTVKVKEAASEFNCTAGMSDDELLESIRGDNLDILIDLGGYTNGGNRLKVFGSRAARSQVSYLGYPFTSSLHTIDYRISDGFVDPFDKTDYLYSERLLRMQDGHFAWRPYAECQGIIPAPTPPQSPLIGVFNNPIKISPSCLKCWSNILRRVPDARLLFKYGNQYHSSRARDRMLAHLAAQGVNTDRVLFHVEPLSIQQHLQVMANVDLALDPFPYQGTMTSLECLSVGTPIISRCGEYYVQRATSAMLMRIGLDELVAADADEYEEIAVDLLNSVESLRSLRHIVKKRFFESSVVDVTRFAKELTAVFRAIAEESINRR